MSKLLRLAATKGPELVSAATPKFITFLKYARVEMTPPKPGEFKEVAKGFGNLARGFKTGRWRQLTVRVIPIFYSKFT